MTQYEDDRLYCLGCREQPDHFEEVMSWQVFRVEPDGTLIDTKDGELLEYRCPQCHNAAEWGRDMKESKETSRKKGRG